MSNEGKPANEPAVTIDDVLSGRASPSRLSTPDPSPDAGKSAQAAPDAGKTGADTGKPAEKTDAAPDKGKPPDLTIKPEDLEGSLFGVEKPEDQIARFKRDLAASSKEAQRLHKGRTKLSEMLAEQGLEIIEEDGVPVGLAPGKGYSKDAKAASVRFKDLSEDEQALFADDPQTAIDLLAGRITKALVRAAPTVENYVRPLSEERMDAALAFVRDAADVDGVKMNPEFADNMPFIKKMLANPQMKGLKDLFNASPEFALQLLSDRVSMQRMRLRDAGKRALEAQKKAEAAKTDQPPLGPSSGRQAQGGGTKSYAEEWGKKIAAAPVA
jgi:hypothetical protein